MVFKKLFASCKFKLKNNEYQKQNEHETVKVLINAIIMQKPPAIKIIIVQLLNI